MPRPLPAHLLAATGGDAEEVRAHILDAAHRVIEREGLAGASTRAIATEAELGAGTLYNYFDDRSHLIVESLLRHAHLVARPLGALPGRVGTRTVLVNVSWFARQAGRALDELVPSIGAAFSDPEVLARLRAALAHDDPSTVGVEVLGDYLRAEQEIGRVRSTVDCDAAAAVVVGLCHDRAFQHVLLGAPPKPVTAAIELIAEAIAT